MKQNYKKSTIRGGRGFGTSHPEPITDDISVAAGTFEVILYDADRGVKLLVTTTEDHHPGELVGMFAEAGEEAGLDYNTLQGTAKSTDNGWVISWVPPGQTEKDLQKKLGERWKPVLEAQS